MRITLPPCRLSCWSVCLIPWFLQPLIGNSWLAAGLLYGIPVLLLMIALVIGYFVVGACPRRRRGLKRARQRLKEGAWEDALERVRKVRGIGMPSKSWKHAFDKFEAECMSTAAQVALDEANFEQALQYSLKAADLRGRDDLEVRASIQSAMLAEVRRLFAIKH